MNEILILDDMKDLNMILGYIPEDFELENNVTICRKYEDAILYLKIYNLPNILYLDHDLGQEKSGYDFLKYIITNYPVNEVKNCDICFISFNPVGRKNMEQLLERFLNRLE